MSIIASQLIAKVSVSGASEAEAALKGVGVASEGAGSKLSSLGGLAIGAGVAIASALVAIGTKATFMAGDFQASMTQLVTGAGEAQANLQMVSDGILHMASQVGQSTSQLASGMYLIESAGQHGAQALITLQDAAEGAKVGAASLADVANGVTTIMTDYAAKHITAAQATNTLISAVAQGKTHLADLSRAMSTVLPTAAAIGVSLSDTAGAMATMTAEGTSAASAATYLRQMLMALESPASKGAAALKSIGLSTSDVANEMKKSLPDTLQMITDDLAKKFPVGSAAYVAALKDIAGGSRQMQGMLELTGSHLKVFQGDVKNITDTVKKGGDSIVGWSDVTGDFNFKLDQAKAAIEALMIGIGTKLLPIVTSIIGAITPVIGKITDWVTQSHNLGNAFSWLSPIGSAISNTFNGIVKAIQSPEFGYLAQTLQNVFLPALQAVGNAVIHLFQPAMQSLSGVNSGGIADTLRQAALGVSVFVEALQGIKDGSSGFEQAGTQVRTIALQIWDVMKMVGTYLADTFRPVLTQVTSTVNSQIIPAWNDLLSSLQPMMPQLEQLAEGFGYLVVGALMLFAQVLAHVMELAVQAFGGIITAASGLVSFLTGAVVFIHDLFVGDFSKLGSDLGAIWTGIVNIFRGAFNIIDVITGGMLSNVSLLFQKLGITSASTADTMSKNVSNSTKTMASNVNGNFSNMSNTSLNTIQTFSNTAISILGKMGNDGANIMKSLDQSTITYWNAIADYIDLKSAQAAQVANENLGSIHVGGKSYGPVNSIGSKNVNDSSSGPGYASGTSFAPGGPAVVGENGPELVYLPRGSQVIPNNQLGSGGHGSPNITVQPTPIYLDGHALMQGLLPYLASSIRYNTGVHF